MICCVDTGGLVKIAGNPSQPEGFRIAAEKVSPSKYGKIRASLRKGGAFFNMGVSSISAMLIGDMGETPMLKKAPPFLKEALIFPDLDRLTLSAAILNPS